MAKDIPDYMRGFDLNDDWGFVPVSSKPKESKPGVDEKQLDSKFEGTNIELAKVKTDVSSIKSMTSIAELPAPNIINNFSLIS